MQQSGTLKRLAVLGTLVVAAAIALLVAQRSADARRPVAAQEDDESWSV